LVEFGKSDDLELPIGGKTRNFEETVSVGPLYSVEARLKLVFGVNVKSSDIASQISLLGAKPSVLSFGVQILEYSFKQFLQRKLLDQRPNVKILL
jgi:hypothetical protein